MTGKYRVNEIVKFNYSDIGEYIDENHTDRPLRNDILVKLLNDLSHENEQLKSRVDYLDRKIQRERNSTHKQYAKWEKEAEDKIKELSEENEQLKRKVDFYKYFQKDARELEKENIQLKQELAIYRKLMSCSNCKYHNYDWYDDGDEFEVCDKGNDVTDGICKDWEEIE